MLRLFTEVHSPFIGSILKSGLILPGRKQHIFTRRPTSAVFSNYSCFYKELFKKTISCATEYRIKFMQKYRQIFWRYKLIFNFVLLWLGVAAQQVEDVQIVHLNNELSGSSITTIFQDHQGFMWFGTRSGLYKFDGIEFTSYECDNFRHYYSFHWLTHYFLLKRTLN